VIGQNNIREETLIDRDKVIFPPLHIKLSLMKQFMKALNKEGECFKYICKFFSRLSSEKLKAGIFDGPQIRHLTKDLNFVLCMNEFESAAWTLFVAMIQRFLGNFKDENYKDLVQNCLNSFHNLGCNMSIQVHFLFSYIDKFPNNLGDASDEQGERFYQDIKIIEGRYKGRWGPTMMADYC